MPTNCKKKREYTIWVVLHDDLCGESRFIESCQSDFLGFIDNGGD